MKTYSAKPTEVTRLWHLVDAKDHTLGRLASEVASLLTGKHKPMYTAHIDCGDNVVVVNAANIRVTGSKLTDKSYFHHSGYPGGIKEISLESQLSKDPTEVIRHAVKGMLPSNRLTDDRLKRLKVYATADHAHDPQMPKPYAIKTDNSKGGK
jgi:large subunit ribosomal protein L13